MDNRERRSCASHLQYLPRGESMSMSYRSVTYVPFLTACLKKASQSFRSSSVDVYKTTDFPHSPDMFIPYMVSLLACGEWTKMTLIPPNRAK
jgi:hypothetical protein